MILKSCKKIFNIYHDSYRLIQVSIFILAFLSNYFLMKHIEKSVIEDNYAEVLNGFGVMTAFFILALDKIDISVIKKKMNIKVGIGRQDEILMSKKLINTIFSLMVSMFFVLGLLYILLIFGEKSFFLLIYLCFLIFFGFIFLISIWHWIDSNDE